MPNLDGKVAVITGSSKGIGASIAERLSKDGAPVVGNYSRSADFAEALSSAFRVDVITRVLALELGPRKIRVVGMAPGLTATEGLSEMEAIDQSATDYAISRTQLGRLGKPEDIANAVAFLVSNDSRWITGEILQTGGGLRLRPLVRHDWEGRPPAQRERFGPEGAANIVEEPIV